jgi:hypothetical protein
MLSKSLAIRVASLTISFMTLAACGNASFKNNDKKKGASDQEQLAAQSNDDGCLSLGGPAQNPGQNPGQNPNAYDQGGNDDVVVVVPPNKGQEPPPPPPGKGGYNPPPSQGQPCTSPGQQPPCKSNCGKDDGYRPIDTDGGVVVQPFPTQRPIDSGCGVKGKYCDDGGPGQWPTQTVNGGTYDRNRAQGCMAAFQNAGYDTRGQWNIDAREVRNVNVLSQDSITDFGTAHTLVMIKSVGVLGTTHFELLNPNALYCIENVSVFEQVLVSSCHSGNVVWGKDVNVLSSVKTQPVDCR